VSREAAGMREKTPWKVGDKKEELGWSDSAF